MILEWEIVLELAQKELIFYTSKFVQLDVAAPDLNRVCFGRRWHGQCLSSRKMKQKVGRSRVHESAKFNNHVLVRTRKEKKKESAHSILRPQVALRLQSCCHAVHAWQHIYRHWHMEDWMKLCSQYEWLPYHSRSSIHRVSVLYSSLIRLYSANAPFFFEKKRKLLILANSDQVFQNGTENKKWWRLTERFF
jgi:hypothetical protein